VTRSTPTGSTTTATSRAISATTAGTSDRFRAGRTVTPPLAPTLRASPAECPSRRACLASR
jgi:hypothetical protein